jgi:uncharacterized membrane protein YadS
MQTSIKKEGIEKYPVHLPPLLRRTVFILVAVLCLFPFISAPLALLLGLVAANTIGHPFAYLNGKATKILLQVSVVGLGFGMNVHSALSAGKEGFLFTVVSISGILILGLPAP